MRVLERFGVRPLWIATDHIAVAGPDTVRRRLDLVLERTNDDVELLTAGSTFSWARQDAVAGDVADTVGTASRSRLFHAPSGKHVSDGLLVFRAALDDAYARLALEHDELDVLDRRATFVGLDSKQKVDHHHQGNWYYYWR